MADVEQTSDSEMDDPKKVTDAASCLEYLKRKEVFLYKMMNDPSHKAMLYFLEVLMNSEVPVTVEQLAARFSHKTFSLEMREACGGGSPEGLREFLLRYPSLFNVRANGQVTSVAIELPSGDGLQDLDACFSCTAGSSSFSNDNYISNFDGFGNSSVESKKLYRPVRPRLHNQAMGATTAVARKVKAKSMGSVSLASTPSNLSSSSESFSYFDRFTGADKVDAQTGKSTKPDAHRHACCTSNQTLSETKRTGPNQDAHIRERQTHSLCDANVQNSQCCERLVKSPTSVSGTCVHCPLLDLTCHHHHPACTVGHHHHHHHHATTTTLTHCLCAHTRLTCAPHCYQCPSVPAQANHCKSGATNPTTICALPPLELLTLETEAVRFFQQRLLKRDERWVQVKSLAGHLSQASSKIRAIVGPQLEFRNFLLRHPHVFEVQGELVSVRDPFGAMYPLRKDRERQTGIHTSLSSSSLLLGAVNNPVSSTNMLRNSTKPRIPRPKSLILPNTQPISQTAAPTAQTRRNMESRYLADCTDNFMNAYYPTTSGPSHSVSSSSAPNTPTAPKPTSITWDREVKPTDTSTPVSLAQTALLTTPNALHSTASTNSLSISMSANEYRSIMFVRKVMEKRGGTPGQPGVLLTDLMQLLSTKAPESIQSTIGWTKVQVEEFLNQHPIFFEISHLPHDVVATNQQTSVTGTQPEELTKTVVRNKRLEKMINIVITGTKPAESSLRALTNRCGRVYHVAKLWGIIDLGKHEHVFFDKSIFKHVDDLQKYFKVDELLYFNAIVAPKESRAKWRATHVWKECEQPVMEIFGGQRFTSDNPLPNSNGNAPHPIKATREFKSTLKRRDAQMTLADVQSIECEQSSGNEDTEADEEIEDIDVEALNSTDGHGAMCAASQRPNESDGEFALNGDEEIEDEEPLISALARQEGLHLINDVKFITDDICEETFSNKHVSSTQTGFTGKSYERCDKCRIPANKDESFRLDTSATHHLDNTHNENDQRNNFVSSSTENTPSECTSSLNSRMCSCELSSRRGNTTSLSSNGSCSISIAVQTVSTGEIMATQLYHDQNKESCVSG